MSVLTAREMKTIRINRGVSRRALAREIDVPEQTLRRIEAGSNISLAYAKRIADWYGVEVLDILPRELEPDGVT